MESDERTDGWTGNEFVFAHSEGDNDIMARVIMISLSPSP